ncbi:MAG: serine/threonine-protein kinase [Planctomycetaceae bacterium]
MAQQLLSPASHPEMLGRIGRYDVERLIGSGGMGVVFKAFDTELNRPVAVKVLAPYLAGSGAARKRFAREARAAAAIVHEHVVAIHNVETEEASPFLVMQYVAGESLQQRIDREGPLDVCEILRIGMQTASGLAAAHAQGLVHRDVKPSNILLERGIERTLLTDFGLARASDDASLTHSGFHPGTPQYMSPEQARGEAVDARSDLFSLGSVIYTMCAGRSPFRADSSYAILRRIIDEQPRPIREVNSQIPTWLEGIIQKLHAKSPDDRFQSADEVAGVLGKCLAHVQQPTTVQLPEECRSSERALISPRRRRTIIAGCAAAVVIGLLMFRENGPGFREGEAPAEPRSTPDALSAIDSRNRLVAPATEPNSELPAASDSDAAGDLDWNTLSEELQSFDADLAPFETRSQELWDTSREQFRSGAPTQSEPTAGPDGERPR